MTTKLTAAGRNLLLRALTGEQIKFTKVQLGNGSQQTPEEATELINPIFTAELSGITIGDNYVTLTVRFTNSTVKSGFHITEAGYFAVDPDDKSKEILYAIGNEDESTADYVPDNANRVLEMQVDSIVFIGDAENVTAAISSALVYASKDEFDKHIEDHSNPHVVTKAQVGLGNVPNVSTDNQTPTFTEAKTLANIKSGETIRTIFGKIELAITSLINHLKDHENPHGCTAAQVGAAAKVHTHDASDINDGTLGVKRGGTGVKSISALAAVLSSDGGLAKAVLGTYVGTGVYGSENKMSLTFESPPKILIVMPESNPDSGAYGGFIVLNGVTSTRGGGIMGDIIGAQTLYYTWSGNTVNWYSPNNAYSQQNTSNKTYVYFAIL